MIKTTGFEGVERALAFSRQRVPFAVLNMAADHPSTGALAAEEVSKSVTVFVVGTLEVFKSFSLQEFQSPGLAFICLSTGVTTSTELTVDSRDCRESTLTTAIPWEMAEPPRLSTACCHQIIQIPYLRNLESFG